MFIKHIQTVTAGSAVASIDFTDIPQVYTDLYLAVSMRTTSSDTAWNDVYLRPNSSTTNDTGRILYGTGSATASYDANEIVFRANGGASTSSTFSSCRIYISNYASGTSKSMSIDEITEGNQTQHLQGIGAFVWANNAAISSITLVPVSGNLAQYSSASLYGVVKGTDRTTTVS